MIPVQKAVDAILLFATQDVVSPMPNGMPKFVSLMAVGSVSANPMKFLAPYMGLLGALGIVSEDGLSVDEDKIKAALDGAFASMPSVSWMGFTFSKDDADRLVARMRG